jgi:hypothetical protein
MDFHEHLKKIDYRINFPLDWTCLMVTLHEKPHVFQHVSQLIFIKEKGTRAIQQVTSIYFRQLM